MNAWNVACPGCRRSLQLEAAEGAGEFDCPLCGMRFALQAPAAPRPALAQAKLPRPTPPPSGAAEPDEEVSPEPTRRGAAPSRPLSHWTVPPVLAILALVVGATTPRLFKSVGRMVFGISAARVPVPGARLYVEPHSDGYWFETPELPYSKGDRVPVVVHEDSSGRIRAFEVGISIATDHTLGLGGYAKPPGMGGRVALAYVTATGAAWATKHPMFATAPLPRLPLKNAPAVPATPDKPAPAGDSASASDPRHHALLDELRRQAAALKNHMAANEARAMEYVRRSMAVSDAISTLYGRPRNLALVVSLGLDHRVDPGRNPNPAFRKFFDAMPAHALELHTPWIDLPPHPGPAAAAPAVDLSGLRFVAE